MKIKPVIGRVGGKARLAPWILEFIKQHQFSIYCEPFCGSSAVYFALLNDRIPEEIKARGRHFRAVLNDIDKEIMSLYRTVRDYPEILAYSIYFTPYSRAEHKEAQQRGNGTEERIEAARKYLTDNWQSFGHQNGLGFGVNRRTYASEHGGLATDFTPEFFSTLPQRILTAAPHLGTPETLDPYSCLNATGRSFVEPDVDFRVEWARRYLVDGWQSHVGGGGKAWGIANNDHDGKNHPKIFNTLPSRILAASPHLQQDLDALKKVYLECDDAIKCIERWATPETLFYVDAPYVSCENYYSHNAKQGKDYNLELHYRLAECLNTVECAGAIVSYYPDELLDELYPEEHWERHYKETVASSAGITRQSKTRTRPKRTELLLVRKNRNEGAVRVPMSGQLGLF